MIGFMPTLYPDELVYSFVARYHTYTKNGPIKQTVQELFGSDLLIATPDLPTHLQYLVDQINVFHPMELEELVGEHTFFNFYTNFSGEKTRQFVKRAMMTGNTKGAIHMKTGVMASGVKEKKMFQICPMCIKEDLDKLGETYWRVTHQLPGVLICTKHHIWLEESTVFFRSKERLMFYTTPDEVKETATKRGNGRLFLIAKECEILSIQPFHFDLKKLQEIYKYLLHRQGFFKGNKVNQEKLADHFTRFYGKDLLLQLQSTVDYHNSSCWLKAITRKHRKSFHPIRHILFILFLQETLESIVKIETSNSLPFGEGPYPCLNKAAKHYRRLTISTVEINVCCKTNVPVGLFKCRCGFHYSRKGFNQDKSNRYKYGRVIQFGDAWIDEVKKQIHEQKLSYRSVARSLGVDTNTVIKYSKLQITVEKDPTVLRKEEMIKKQSVWLHLVKENKDLSVTEIRAIDSALYSWLYRNCKKWLQLNSPKIKKVTSKRMIDWNQRDKEIVEEVTSVYSKLLQVAPPIRITLSRIGNEIGKRSLLEKHLILLPRTKKTLEQMVEDISSFQIRRINFIVKQFDNNEKQIKEWELRKMAGLRAKVVDKRVEKEIKKIFNDLSIFKT